MLRQGCETGKVDDRQGWGLTELRMGKVKRQAALKTGRVGDMQGWGQAGFGISKLEDRQAWGQLGLGTGRLKYYQSYRGCRCVSRSWGARRSAHREEGSAHLGDGWSHSHSLPAKAKAWGWGWCLRLPLVEKPLPPLFLLSAPAGLFYKCDGGRMEV